MDREKAKALLPIITAYANGETIQIDTAEGWEDTSTELYFTAPVEVYRIKPKPRTFYGVMYGTADHVKVYPSQYLRDNSWIEDFSETHNVRKITLVEVLE